MKKVLIPVVELITVRLPQIMMRRVAMSFSRPSKTRKEKPGLALESGFHFLLENGGRILLEKGKTQVFPPRPPKVYPAFLLETGGRLLQEDGCKIQLEHN